MRGAVAAEARRRARRGGDAASTDILDAAAAADGDAGGNGDADGACVAKYSFIAGCKVVVTNIFCSVTRAQIAQMSCFQVSTTK